MVTLLWLGALAVAGGLAAVVVGAGRTMLAGRSSGIAIRAIVGEEPEPWKEELSRPFALRVLGPAWEGFARASRAVTPGRWVARLRKNAVLAGLGRWGIEGILAMKASFAAGGALLFPLYAAALGFGVVGVVLWTALGAVAGFILPDIWIAHRGRVRQSEVRQALPETLDLLAIAVEAGMGLEAAFDLVVRRLPGALGDELHRMLQELALGMSRREALANLRGRTEVTELSTFALSLAQADALGTPLALVLRTQAAEMRMLRRQRAREQAAKIPVQLLFPLLLGIFPALGVVVVGPAAIAIIRAFGGS